MYCGGTIVVRDAIHAAAIASLPNLLKLARTALQSRNYREAYDYFTRVLEADSDNWEAWAGKAEASGLMSGPQEVRLQEIITCFGHALQSVPEQERDILEHKIADVVDMVVGQYYTQMRAALSPAFGEEAYWHTYLTQLRNILGALEETYKLVPNDASIVKAILHVCNSNRERVSYINRFTGQASLRWIPQDMRIFVAELIASHTKKPETSELATPQLIASLDPKTSSVRNQILIMLGAVLILVGLGLISFLIDQNHSSGSFPSSSSSTTSSAFPGTAEEKAYLEATLRYLRVHYDQSKSAATTMASAESGGVTLDEIRTALYTSRAAIDRSWKDDFLPVSNKSVPSKYAEIDKRIRRVHDSQQAAFEEMLSYWEDRSTSHITRGSEMFKQSLLECDATIKELNKILDSYVPKNN
jgi:tetratricopeptide (TPR) repeat protein